jgi:trans-AT polyketide synthase/acyltransferase/oxidoreductase domain-containing protein
MVKIEAMAEQDLRITAESLGCTDFKRDHRVRYAYVAGSMYKGISSVALVVRMARAGMLGYFGAGGVRSERLEEAIRVIQAELRGGGSYGMNLLCNMEKPSQEDEVVDLYLKNRVPRIEAAAYIQITPSVVRYRCKGMRRRLDGSVEAGNMILAKASHPEVAEQFLSPAPERILRALLDSRKITAEEAAMAREVPMADDLCAEADSGGHTDQAVSATLIPAMVMLRDRIMQRFGYAKKIRVGAAGGIGTPHAAASAFILGADFILTGSINQCTVDAGTSDAAKDMLQQAGVKDTAIVPAGDMFELGAKVQVLKRGLLFPARANKLYDLYRNHGSLEEIDDKTREQIQTKYFKRSFEEVWEETRKYYMSYLPEVIERVEGNPKHKLALIFRWYFVHSTRLSMKGSQGQKVDYQIQCGPAMGAFNEYVRGTPLESWRNRHADKIAELLMKDTAALLQQRIAEFAAQ